MPLTIFCPGGSTSQSGSAVRERYSDAAIESCGKIPAVLSMLTSHDGPFVIPVWNSHEGEVKAASYVWDSIQQAQIRITDAWAKSIEFWFVRRSGKRTFRGKIGSVAVAETQCSGFLNKKGAVLEKRDLTTVAFDEYKRGAEWDGVLIAPGQGANEPGYDVVCRQTANPNNFTSFVQLVPSRAFAVDHTRVKSWLTGVRMPTFGASLGDAEQEFFERLLEPVRDTSEIPKLIFVFSRDAKVGLLFEGAQLHAADLLDAEQLEGDEISIYENAGALTNHYTAELNRLFSQGFPDLQQDDFVVHCGVNTCLFTCPPLGIYTHGYKIETVEPVVRFFISRLFQLWNDEILKCTPEQADFFKRHNTAWQEKGSEFMQFKAVTAT